MSNGIERCHEYMLNDLKSGPECAVTANLKGMSLKSKIAKLGGSMTDYKAKCIAIDSKGWNVDYSFDISYNIS